jgi:two-component system cell cycle sensor histidine kinase/response regulator CckA
MARSCEWTPPPKDSPEDAEAGTILLVDDEAAIRTLTHLALGMHGYRVLEAADGLQALEIYRREPGRIDLVILDVMMPKLSGPQTLERLLALDPAVRVVFTSGAHAGDLTEADRARSVGFFAKPFRLEDLTNTVRTVLQAGRC